MSIRIRRVLALGSLLAASLHAAAAPEDDHKKAMLAYSRGDVVGAMAALRAPAKAGHAPSQVLLAFILDRADFFDEAAPLYQAAAAQNEPEGHAGIANYYLTGRGVAKDEKAAVRHFSKAADLGHESSIMLLAEAYLKGSMGLAGAPDADVLAAVSRAAERGHLPSMEAIAQAHTSGRWGAPVDAKIAADWQARAAKLRAERARARPPAPAAKP